MIPKLTAASLSVFAFACFAACSSEDDRPEDINPATADCTADDQNEPAKAIALAGGPGEGFICPKGDLDWYSFSVPAADKLVTVNVTMPVALSPIQPTYAIFPRGPDGEPGVVAAQTPANASGTGLTYTHCVAPGDYYLLMRDQGDDSVDTRNAYAVNVSSGPDPDMSEPNADTTTATALTSGTPVTGYIACRGDQDWYTFDVPPGRTLSIQLDSAQTMYEPTLQIYDADSNLLVEEQNLAGTTEPTAIARFEVLPGAGKYYLKVADDDDENADPAVAYTLKVDFIQDADPHEPNNTPDEAVKLSASAVTCGGSWSQTFTSSGSIGSPGDDDWYRIDLSGCGQGIIEATVEYDNAGMTAAQQWEFNAEIQSTVTLVRPHAGSACNDDGVCNTLQKPCDGPLDCAGLFDTCLSQGFCAGATVCLPTGTCGANQVQRRYECNPRLNECKPSTTPPPKNQARLAAPILGDNVLFLRVTDYQSNGSAPEKLYTIKVRVRNDPDTHELNNLPLNVIAPDYERSDLFGDATPIIVHDCTAGDCCGGADLSGSIGYESDVDYYRFSHPCPGQDCTLRMVWNTQAGPVDIALNVYRDGGSSWNVAREPDEMANQPAASGTLGGTTEGNGCFYAYQSHSSDYIVEVRDRFELFSDDVTVRPDSRDWDPDQGYGFCIEKVANSCSAPPCQVYPNGCGQPQ